MLRRLVLALSLFVALPGCLGSSDDAASDSGVDEGGLTGQKTLGTGVQYLDTGAGGDDVLITYAGYSVTQDAANAWSSRLHAAAFASSGVRHVYSVRGPKSASYAEREIANTALAKHLLPLATEASSITVIAHSSGSYVAHELLSHLYVAGMDHGETTGKITYYNLDGGGDGLTTTIVNELRAVRFVYVNGVRGNSANAGTMQALGSTWPGQGESRAVDGGASGCTKNARWCLHDVLINQHPYNHAAYDLPHDYGQINDAHPLQASYLDK